MDVKQIWQQTYVQLHVWPEYAEPVSDGRVDINGSPEPIAIHAELNVDAWQAANVTVPVREGVGETLGQALIDLGLQMAYPDFSARIEAIVDRVKEHE